MATIDAVDASAYDVPASWEGSDVLDGLDIVDKQQLIDVPFRILGAFFQRNQTGVSNCFIDGERGDGSTFTFTDSSTGVRAQVLAYLTAKGLDADVETGEYIEFKIVAPKGLRISEYERQVTGPNGQPIRGKTATARTYYLTTSGKRPQATSKPTQKSTATRTK